MPMPTELLDAGIPVDARAPDPQQDAVDGVLPSVVLTPQTPEAAAATLAWASRQNLSVVIRGAGTKLGWGWRPAHIDAVLCTRGLQRMIQHRAGDLTVTVEAGLALGDLNRALAAHGQWLPLDPPHANECTIGGLLATNDSGPRRHRFGTPRDLVIGIQLATVDGRLGKAGGQVVKNVAGYDLSKLVSGSFGTLAAITSATFKLSPLPGASATLIVDAVDAGMLGRVAEAVHASQLEPVAFDCHVRRGPGAPVTSCLIRFASIPAVVESQIDAARACLSSIGIGARVAAADEDVRVWQDHRQQLWDAPGALVRASWSPATLAAVAAALPGLGGLPDVELSGHVSVGAGLLRLGGDAAGQVRAIDALRQSPLFGNVVVRRGSDELRSAIDVWGAVPNRPLLDAVKHALDPNGTLGAGRGPL